ncbi:siderophore-interacting protein [Gordonia terrae C-6]|uniref:Siderophore-interacting protein n=1 Tax=Gordonia terrae C-6 TaxID=1316928 RepID=R7Y7U1_9ACTN|nr:siderophore-interacting protein [Gordonia terrae]EON32097.1 siderophore-interacting protein [Gordonia terrae C-6]
MTQSIEAARPWEYSAFPVKVAWTQRISPHFIRVTLTDPRLTNFAPWGLDQRIKLVLPMDDGTEPDFGLLEEPTPHPKQWYARWKELPADRRNELRTYTPSAIRPDAGEIDVDVFVHEPAGPASRWALTCAVGDRLVITGPDVRVGRTGYGIHFQPPHAPSQLLLVGDESAMPAIANILAATPPTTSADVLLELADPLDDIVGARRTHGRIQHVIRGHDTGRRLEDAVRDWGTRRAGEFRKGLPAAYAWIAGEATTTTRIRRYLTNELGMDKDHVAFLGYWKLGGPLVG